MSFVKARLKFIEPQLASPVDQPPEGKHWIHEIKHDGYRCQVLLERGQARVLRNCGRVLALRIPPNFIFRLEFSNVQVFEFDPQS
jgi:hypothetical protein